MGFDFNELENLSKKLKDNTVLEAMCLGGGGAGKSTLAGTLDGKILYIYGESERHGIKNARTNCAGQIVGLCIDTYKNPTKDPDIALGVLQETLKDIEGIKNNKFTSVVIDGAVELEAIIRQTKLFKKLCLTKDGKHNTFSEPIAIISIFREILSCLRSLADEGIHYYMTCALDVKAIDDEDGSIIECTPRLSTYSVIETLLLQFPDIFIIGEMSNGKKTAHRIQFGTTIEKVSKNLQGGIKRFLNFRPRLNGVKDVPTHIKADLKELIRLKKEVSK